MHSLWRFWSGGCVLLRWLRLRPSGGDAGKLSAGVDSSGVWQDGGGSGSGSSDGGGGSVVVRWLPHKAGIAVTHEGHFRHCMLWGTQLKGERIRFYKLPLLLLFFTVMDIVKWQKEYKEKKLIILLVF